MRIQQVMIDGETQGAILTPLRGKKVTPLQKICRVVTLTLGVLWPWSDRIEGQLPSEQPIARLGKGAISQEDSIVSFGMGGMMLVGRLPVGYTSTG
jgi:hypothetical protein